MHSMSSVRIVLHVLRVFVHAVYVFSIHYVHALHVFYIIMFCVCSVHVLCML